MKHESAEYTHGKAERVRVKPRNLEMTRMETNNR